jgi:sodium pump decarboxylase gamma subunit
MSLLDSLFVSIFGIAVVFIVLIFLSLLVRLQSALVAGFTKRKTALAEAAKTAEAPVSAGAEAPAEGSSEAAAAEARPKPTADIQDSLRSGNNRQTAGLFQANSTGAQAARKYTALFGGKTFDVEVEELNNIPQPAVLPAPKSLSAPAEKSKPAAAEQTGPMQKPAAVSSKPADINGEAVTAPVPGLVLEVKTSVGAKVKRGDILLLIEAMKMENEIVAGRDGVVAQVLTAKGAAVDAGTPLVVLQ